MQFRLVKNRHCVGECNFHIQLTVAYRRKIFARKKVKKLCRAYLLSAGERHLINITAIEFGPDHVHIFVTHCKNYSVTRIVKLLKGFSSYMMRKNHRKLFEDMLWGDKFWTSGYFYRSVGSVTSETIKFYIEHSQRKHWETVDCEYFEFGEQKTLKNFASHLSLNPQGFNLG